MYTLYLKVCSLIWVISVVEINKFLLDIVKVNMVESIGVPSKLVKEYDIVLQTGLTIFYWNYGSIWFRSGPKT